MEETGISVVSLPLRADVQATSKEVVQALRNLLVEIEAGKITAFVFAARTQGYQTWMVRTRMDRIDRVAIIGQLVCITHDLAETENKTS